MAIHPIVVEIFHSEQLMSNSLRHQRSNQGISKISRVNLLGTVRVTNRFYCAAAGIFVHPDGGGNTFTTVSILSNDLSGFSLPGIYTLENRMLRSVTGM